jgi:hypothetical protein
MSMFGKKGTKEEPAATPVVAVLPVGHDDEASDWFVPAELRADYQTVAPSLEDVNRAESALNGELVYADAVALQEPVVKVLIEQAENANDQVRATVIRQRFYGGGYGRVYQIGTSAVQENVPEHAFRPTMDYASLGLRTPKERLLSSAERELAAHRARVTVAAGVLARRVHEAEVGRLLTCEVCKLRGDVHRRTIKVAGAEPFSRRCCSLCESALVLKLRQRVSAQVLPSGQTRLQAAAASLDELT